jgi:hypothetical protein
MSVAIDETDKWKLQGELVPYTGALRWDSVTDSSIIGEAMRVGVWDKGRSTTKPPGCNPSIRELPNHARSTSVARGACERTVYR